MFEISNLGGYQSNWNVLASCFLVQSPFFSSNSIDKQNPNKLGEVSDLQTLYISKLVSHLLDKSYKLFQKEKETKRQKKGEFQKREKIYGTIFLYKLSLEDF